MCPVPLPTAVRPNQPLAGLTSWRVGGSAEYLAQPRSVDQLANVAQWSVAMGLRVHPIGAGSNLLVSDEGVQGLSLGLRRLQGVRLDPTTGLVESYAGEFLPTLARKAARAGLQGLEWLAGIPGTVGGAVAMNAGCQGSCLAEWLVDVKLLDPVTGRFWRWRERDMAFGYRHSLLQEMAAAQTPWVVTSVRLRTNPGHAPQRLLHTIKTNLDRRHRTQPCHLPSGGSVFRNPLPMKAGRLIDVLGLKGQRRGDAEISTVHANFIVNRGRAKARHVQALIHLVQDSVMREKSIALQTEIKRLGRFDDVNRSSPSPVG
ncbi:UDP-N-acetylmuramate dehydrogenase [Candidatus Synechococcus spongiarum]|uniref:UDP-N-acetylmuramate dehydrogenase n=1 Tax=Candidatus Synechococcus spongiarum TaxID=431041 RepID=UPI000472E745|nr:UDP-N-acetylmuramate dehydrogenase [Candidatus Synechococcus spongiarum]